MATRGSRVREEIDRALGEVPLVVQKLVDECAGRSKMRYGRLVWLAGEAVGVEEREGGYPGLCPQVEMHLAQASAAMELLGWVAQLHGDVSSTPATNPLDQLLAGDVFYAKSVALAASLPGEILVLFADLACHLAVDRLRLRERSTVASRSVREELELAFAKSGRWLATCCRVGALLVASSDPLEEALTAYGFSLGMALHLETLAAPRREDISPLIASYRKQASLYLSRLPESVAKHLLAEELEKKRTYHHV